VDTIVEAMAEAGVQNSCRLAEMAVEETGIGVVKDKTVKNRFAAEHIAESIRGMKTIGVLSSNDETGIMDVAMPVGIICGIIPTTNPTSTTIFKALIALKSGNSIVFSPHPTARKCIQTTADIMHEAAISAGAPRGLVGCPQEITPESTRELMTHPKTAMILATGGSAMVQAAYSSGKPALGVGPGNVPAYVHSSADIKDAASKIVLSKTFDNGTVCSSEQAIIADKCISSELVKELENLVPFFFPANPQINLHGLYSLPEERSLPILLVNRLSLLPESQKFKS